MSAAGMVQDWAELQRQVTVLTAQRDELIAALSEFTSDTLSDVRTLAGKLHRNNHRVTGTEAERISYLLHYLERSVRFARAALDRAQP